VPFTQDSDVKVKEVDDNEWELLGALEYEGRQDHFTVPIGQRTDFASIPRVFVWFVPRYGRYTKAAILHDYLWRKAVPEGQLTRAEADGLLRRAMRELGVPFLRRWIMWAGVRLGALTKADGRKGWLRESPRVILIAVLILPIVVPPALLILLALGIFYVLEVICWIPLKVSSVIKAKSPKADPPKQINTPNLDFKT
jgi:hypothetical protein